jgi:hypothetical protein
MFLASGGSPTFRDCAVAVMVMVAAASAVQPA